MSKLVSECRGHLARAWVGQNWLGAARTGRNRSLKRHEAIRTNQRGLETRIPWSLATIGTEFLALHPEYCRQRRPSAFNRKNNPLLSCSDGFANTSSSIFGSPFYTSHRPPLLLSRIVAAGGAAGCYALLLQAGRCVCADVHGGPLPYGAMQGGYREENVASPIWRRGMAPTKSSRQLVPFWVTVSS